MEKVNNISLNEEDINRLIHQKEENGDILHGGLGDRKNPEDFDKEQIGKGLSVEKEHTDNPSLALEIVMDHLTEDPQYYGTGNQNPECMAQCDAQEDVPEEKSEDDQLTDILLGFTPHKLGGQLPIH
jgi:hypothetical protein